MQTHGSRSVTTAITWPRTFVVSSSSIVAQYNVLHQPADDLPTPEDIAGGGSRAWPDRCIRVSSGLHTCHKCITRTISRTTKLASFNLWLRSRVVLDSRFMQIEEQYCHRLRLPTYISASPREWTAWFFSSFWDTNGVLLVSIVVVWARLLCRVVDLSSRRRFPPKILTSHILIDAFVIISFELFNNIQIYTFRWKIV